ncbi:MAG: adenylate/guanylate cyclase domain-containing protein, partial [Bacteroidota bacterium]
MKTNQKNRSLAAIMFADMVGFTKMMSEDEKTTILLGERLRSVVQQLVPEHHGQLLQYAGDGSLSIFRSAIDAVRCAILIQQNLQKAPQVLVRIGIHLGEVVFYGQNIYGSSVNIASRIESFATPGSVLISDKVYSEVKNQTSIQALSLGYYDLKNVNREVEIFALSAKGLKLPNPWEMQGKGKNAHHSIGILPFKTAGDEASQTFSDGLTEELLHTLSGIRGLSVASRTSCFSFKGQDGVVQKIASELNVTILLEGSVRRDGDLARVTTQLIDCSDGYQVWSGAFDVKVGRLFATQGALAKEVTQRIVEFLGLENSLRFQQE